MIQQQKNHKPTSKCSFNFKALSLTQPMCNSDWNSKIIYDVNSCKSRYIQQNFSRIAIGIAHLIADCSYFSIQNSAHKMRSEFFSHSWKIRCSSVFFVKKLKCRRWYMLFLISLTLKADEQPTTNSSRILSYIQSAK